MRDWTFHRQVINEQHAHVLDGHSTCQICGATIMWTKPVEPTDLWDDKTIADAESLLEDSDETRDLVADILAVAARQFTEGGEPA